MAGKKLRGSMLWQKAHRLHSFRNELHMVIDAETAGPTGLSVLGTRSQRDEDAREESDQPKKRVKFATSETAESEPQQELKWTYHVNPQIQMKIVTHANPSQVEKSTTFHPEFAHVFFGDDEQLTGFHQPEISFYFNAWSFRSYLQFTYQERHKVLPAPDPIAKITPYLAPNSFTTNWEEFQAQVNEDRKQARTFGELVSSYSLDDRQNPGQKRNFSIYFHQFGKDDSTFDEEFLDFHSRVQAFILLEIDGGTYIEARDPRWEIFLLYEQIGPSEDQPEPVPHLIGYCTAYRFYAFPDRFRLRISQFLLFPPYQKQGHGRRLLQGVYDSAIARGARDIPVEDPAPEFGRLRDMVDMMNLLEDKVFQPTDKTLSRDTLQQIIEKRRLWKNQVRRCFEIYRLAHVKMSDAEDYKDYRFYVKRRLISQNREHLELFEKGEDRKAELHRMYQELEKEYFQIIDKVRTQCPSW